MARVSVELRDDQRAALRAAAARRGVSLAEMVRQGVDRVLADDRRDERVEQIMALAGCVSGPGDLGERHDDYLVNAYSVTDNRSER